MKNSRPATGAHSIAGLFVFFLIGFFALLSVTLVVTGVNVYRQVVTAADHNTDYQIVLSYLCNKIHAHDHREGVRVDEWESMQVLCLTEEIEGELYEARIFFDGTAIWEQFSHIDGEFDPELGEKLAEVKALKFIKTTPNQLLMIVTLPDGSVHNMYMSLRSSQMR